MTNKTTLWLLMCMLCTAGLLTGCQSGKIAYGNSYYFKQTPKPVHTAQAHAAIEATPKTEDTSEATELLAANQQSYTSVKDVEILIEQAQQQMSEIAEKSNNEALKEKAYKVNKISTSIREGSLSKKDMRAKRKELRQEMRSLVKEYKAAPDGVNEVDQMDQTLRLSLLLGGGGLLLFILGAAITGSVGGVLALLGLLALVGGLVTLIIWAAQQ